jgi:hypothetical protein
MEDWAQYQLSGTGTQQVVGGGRIYSSFCVHDTTGNVEWDGCVVRAYDPVDADSTYNYYVDQAQASGHETHDLPWINLRRGGVKNEYRTTNVTILNRSPASDIERSDCLTMGFGATYAGFGASITSAVCPDLWDQSASLTNNPRYHKVEWRGKTHNDREASALTLFKKRPSYGSAYWLVINWYYY